MIWFVLENTLGFLLWCFFKIQDSIMDKTHMTRWKFHFWFEDLRLHNSRIMAAWCGQSAPTHPSIITKSSAVWILSVKRCHDAICPRRAAWHCGLNHKWNSYCNIPIVSPEYTVCSTVKFHYSLHIIMLHPSLYSMTVTFFIIQSTQPVCVMFPNYLFLFTQLH